MNIVRSRLGRHLLLVYLSIAIAILRPVARAIVEECSACQCVSRELRDRLASEKHRDPLDLRNRLDSQGNRYGKVIDFKLSEQRVHDLLEGMCTAMSQKNNLYTRRGADGKYSVIWSDSAKNSSWTDPPRAEKDGRQKELENYCVRLLDEFEDDLIGVLKEESGDLDHILCVQFAKACSAAERAAEDADKSEL